MAGILDSLKCYTDEAVIVSPEDWNYLTCNVIPAIIESIGIQQEYFFGYNHTGGTEITTTKSDLTITDEVRKDDSFTHTPSSAEVEINNADDYEIIVDAGFTINEGDFVELSISYDDGTGYVPVEGAVAYCGA